MTETWNMVQPLWKTVWQFLQKLKIELPYDPAIAMLGVYPKEMKAGWWKDGLHNHYSRNIFNKTQKMEATHTSIKDEWINKIQWMDKNGVYIQLGRPWWLSGKESACQCRRPEFDPWSGMITLEKKMAIHSSVLAWRTPWNLACYNLWGGKESDMT